MRRDIASLAARLMAEDGIDDYGLAKRKAARQLGAADSAALPDNQEIETELRAYQAFYQADEIRERLSILRHAALALMRVLERFQPYLTGSVLTGVAGRYSEVEIDLYADSAKEVEIFLLDHGFEFTPADQPRSGPDAAEMRLRVEGDQGVFLLSIYPQVRERMQRRNPHSGQLAERASIDALVDLLARTELVTQPTGLSLAP